MLGPPKSKDQRIKKVNVYEIGENNNLPGNLFLCSFKKKPRTNEPETSTIDQHQGPVGVKAKGKRERDFPKYNLLFSFGFYTLVMVYTTETKQNQKPTKQTKDQQSLNWQGWKQNEG